MATTNSVEATSQLEKIADELRRLGVLDGPVQAPAHVDSAFGAPAMAFEEWLAQVFLPRALEASETGDWSSTSQVGIAAIRNFDGLEQFDQLVRLLCEFDQMIEKGIG